MSGLNEAGRIRQVNKFHSSHWISNQRPLGLKRNVLTSTLPCASHNYDNNKIIIKYDTDVLHMLNGGASWIPGMCNFLIFSENPHSKTGRILNYMVPYIQSRAEIIKSRCSAVGIATHYGLDDRRFVVRVLIRWRISTPALDSTQLRIQWLQGAFSVGVKAAGSWSSPLSSNQWSGLYIHSLLRIHDVDLSYSHGGLIILMVMINVGLMKWSKTGKRRLQPPSATATDVSLKLS
jgi:hypothetical protein